MCNEIEKCFVHHRNDGQNVDFRGLRARATYIREFAVYSEEEQREMTGAEIDEALIIREQIRMAMAGDLPEESLRDATLRGMDLRKRTCPPLAIVVRVGHGALSDVDFDGKDRVDTLAPVDGQDIDDLHEAAVWAVLNGTYNDQD